MGASTKLGRDWLMLSYAWEVEEKKWAEQSPQGHRIRRRESILGEEA